jgi:hypothetical protein
VLITRETDRSKLAFCDDLGSHPERAGRSGRNEPVDGHGGALHASQGSSSRPHEQSTFATHLAVALSLPPGRARTVIVSITYVVVVFSMLGQGLTFRRVMARLLPTKS